MRVHLDTDFLIHALAHAGRERRKLLALADSEHEVQVSAVVWYEFARGPRTPEQLAVARAFFAEGGILPLTEQIAAEAAEVFRKLGSPRKRAADIAVGVTAVMHGAKLCTHNVRDFVGIDRLELLQG
jgi:predicted nucleic acid-binding protein